MRKILIAYTRAVIVEYGLKRTETCMVKGRKRLLVSDGCNTKIFSGSTYFICDW
jgi:hypothetical protein